MNPIQAGVAALASTIPAPSAQATQGILLSQLDNILGTSLDLKIIATSFESAKKAEAKIVSEIQRLNQILGSYNPNSEFSRWATSAGESVRISEELFTVLAKFDTWREATGGVIQAASEHIAQLWQIASSKGEAPQAADLARTVAEANQLHYVLHHETQSATRLTDVSMRLHSLAKSFVMDQAAEKGMLEPGVSGMVLNIGGDMVVKGDWTEKVAIANPRNASENAEALQIVQINNKAIATSGDYRRGFDVGGQWFSHILDPRSGESANDIISATVIHPDASTAGALATAFTVLSLEEIKSVANENPGTEFLLVTKKGEQIPSENWTGSPILASNSPANSAISYVNLKDKLWNEKQELVINLELAKFEGRFRRPFVAVWIEDEAGQPVRRLAVWYNKPRWLPDLRYFYAAQRKSEIDMTSFTGATRSAGNYSLNWDGKNDQGQFVKQGKYTVFIEAAREHGTYQLIKQEMNFNGKAQDKPLEGNEEITSASLSYRDK
jgi:thiamine biosynthesis lipoprotein ApbE